MRCGFVSFLFWLHWSVDNLVWDWSLEGVVHGLLYPDGCTGFGGEHWMVPGLRQESKEGVDGRDEYDLAVDTELRQESGGNIVHHHDTLDR